MIHIFCGKNNITNNILKYFAYPFLNDIFHNCNYGNFLEFL